jgi:hypothetical protein
MEPAAGTDPREGSVKCYPYRTATVGDPYLEVPRQTTYALEDYLALKAGVTANNHTVYEIVHETRPPVYVWFSNGWTRFGASVTNEPW